MFTSRIVLLIQIWIIIKNQGTKNQEISTEIQVIVSQAYFPQCAPISLNREQGMTIYTQNVNECMSRLSTDVQ